MTSVLLIYPYFRRSADRSRFRFPPLGVSYIASSLQQAGHEVRLLDCSFARRNEALGEALAAKAEVVGIYCMVTMIQDCLWFAEKLRGQTRLLIAGGPLPTCEPESFLQHFDVVVRGEGEQTILEILRAHETGADLGSVAGIAYRKRAGEGTKGEQGVIQTPDRPFVKNLDQIPFPARELLPNWSYIQYGKKKYGFAITTVMSTRGCPFRCEFCSNVVFGGSYRERSPRNVVDEIEQALGLGYDRISFADDVFTLNRDRVVGICDEIRRRGLHFSWECLGRVDALDDSTARKMKDAGCTRIFFGIESGNDDILKLMNKKISTDQAKTAVEVAHRAGLDVGAFFILGYPGDTDDTVLNTLHFASTLPLEYIGLTMPYPLPGTALLERVRDRLPREWRPERSLLLNHVLTFDADFSEGKMWFAIAKGRAQFEIRRRLGRWAPFALRLFEKPTDRLFRWLR